MTSVMDPRQHLDVVIGVDTHMKTHSAAAINARTGAILGQVTLPASPVGYRDMACFADQHSPDPTRRLWAIEGTGSHGAGLARHLHAHDELITELDRPERTKRRNGAKSDPIDAIRAAREALARPHLATPRRGDQRHALSVLLAARRSAVLSAADAKRQLFCLVITAPDPVRAKFSGTTKAMVTTALTLRTHPSHDPATEATITALRALARRAKALNDEAKSHEKAITAIVKAWRPDLLDQLGVGPIVAATILCAWSHPGRFRSEAAFAMLAGTAPIPANSGQVTTRHRLNRHGDRQLNRALHTVAVVRLRQDPATKAYAKARLHTGKTLPETRRALKRYIARDLFRLLEHPPHEQATQAA